MTLLHRERAILRIRRWAEDPTGPLTVWGAPGIGKTALVRAALPDWTWAEGEAPDLSGPIIWDGADPAEARARLKSGMPVVVTSRGRLDLSFEQSLEVPPLSAEASIVLLRQQIEAMGHQLDEHELADICTPLDGIPLAIVRAARWLDIVGVDGLRIEDPSGWRGPRDVPPHLDSMSSALDDAWTMLSDAQREALGLLALSRGVVSRDMATALIPDAFERLRELRDLAWLHAPGPGVLRLLGPIRAYLLRTAPPTAARRDQLANWLLDDAVVRWEAHEKRGNRDPAPLDDYLIAVEHRPSDARVAAALSMLAALRPSPSVLEAVEQARTVHPFDIDLIRAHARLHRAAGDLIAADRTLEEALDLAQDAQRGVVLRELGVLAHRGRRVASARSRYEAALPLQIEADDLRSVALTRANLAALDHDLGQLEEARTRYVEGLDALWRHGDRRLEGILRSNLALLEAECDKPDRARDELTRAIALLSDTDDARLEAIARGNLGWLCFVEGMPYEAEVQLTDALALLRTHQDVRTEATCRARLAATWASLGQHEQAKMGFEHADRVLAGTQDRLARRLVALARGFLDIAVGARADAVARITSARNKHDGDAPLTSVSEDARSMVRALESRLLTSPGTALCIGEGASWFQAPEQERVSLARYRNARRLLLAMARTRLERPDVAMDVAALFASGWPDEKIQSSSARNRVHVNLNKLRALGLKPLILRRDDGYVLDPAVPLLMVGEPTDEP